MYPKKFYTNAEHAFTLRAYSNNTHMAMHTQYSRILVITFITMNENFTYYFVATAGNSMKLCVGSNQCFMFLQAVNILGCQHVGTSSNRSSSSRVVLYGILQFLTAKITGLYFSMKCCCGLR